LVHSADTTASPNALPYWVHVVVDARVAVFALLLAVACGAAFSIFPALM